MANTTQVKKPKKRTQFQEVARRFKKNKGAMAGLIFILILVILACLSDVIFDYDEQIIAMNNSQRMIAPCWEHPFGTDYMGRDVFYRVIYGTRYSLIVGVLSILIASVIGAAFGAIAGYKGGWIENLIMRLRDMFSAIPSTLLAICLCAAFGQGLTNLILAMGISSAAVFVTYTRSAVLQVRGCEYIEAARAIGATDKDIIMKHLIPNSLSPIIVQITVRIGGAITGASALSFIGLGVPLPTPEWGAMLSDGRAYLRNTPWMTLFPGLAILCTVVAFNLVGDGVRDALDPKLKN